VIGESVDLSLARRACVVALDLQRDDWHLRARASRESPTHAMGTLNGALDVSMSLCMGPPVHPIFGGESVQTEELWQAVAEMQKDEV
jgi:hypothetical protein